VGGRSQQRRRRPPWAWWLRFGVIQSSAFAIALALDPAGFDPCGPEPTGPRGVQIAVAGLGITLPAALAIAFLRRWNLLLALAAVALSVAPWVILLGPNNESCEAPIGNSLAAARPALDANSASGQ
jgi:hypothetical protein